MTSAVTDLASTNYRDKLTHGAFEKDYYIDGVPLQTKRVTFVESMRMDENALSTFSKENFALRIDLLCKAASINARIKQRESNVSDLMRDLYQISPEVNILGADPEMLQNLINENERLEGELRSADIEIAKLSAEVTTLKAESDSSRSVLVTNERRKNLGKGTGKSAKASIELAEANKEVSSLQAQLSEEKHKREKISKSAEYREKRYLMELDVMRKALDEEQKERRALQRKLHEESSKVSELQKQQSVADSIVERELDRKETIFRTITAAQQAQITELHLKLEAEQSRVDLERQSRLNLSNNDLSDIDDKQKDLSSAAAELCKSLTDPSAKLGEKGTMAWRDIVLSEMNATLLRLYEETKDLEDKRSSFISRFCARLQYKERVFSATQLPLESSVLVGQCTRKE